MVSMTIEEIELDMKQSHQMELLISLITMATEQDIHLLKDNL